MKRLKRRGESVVVGIDQSATGTAAVELVDGHLGRVMFFADTKKRGAELRRAADPNVAALDPVTVKSKDPEALKLARLRALRDELHRFLALVNPTHAALEGYALTHAPMASRVLGEVGGQVRLAAADAGVRYRVYEIDSIKTFATGKADAEKADMVLACRDRWDEPNFLVYGKTDGAAGNLADAYVIAQLLHLELRVRAGEVIPEDLDARSRGVLRRSTPKKQPVCILEQPFVEVR